ncbi:MAG: hybrid sensor histidine kinase/response regulator [Acidobacteria bacterium]|nr:hybrid sensor histidine kinase/response regulator [Acidobacteriota bacterium]
MEKPYVLLVDDNEATCTLVTALLQRDFAVESVNDGLDALEKLKTKKYAAILLDLRMPHMDGYGVLDYLKATRPDTLGSVIILTASLAPKELARVKEYAVCAIVPKPFEVESLLALVRQCAGTEPRHLGATFLSSGMIILIADLLRQRLM